MVTKIGGVRDRSHLPLFEPAHKPIGHGGLLERYEHLLVESQGQGLEEGGYMEEGD